MSRSSATRRAGKSSLIAALSRREAEDRRLPVHDAAPEPRRRRGGRPPATPSPTCPASSRARARARDSASSSCATSSAARPCCTCSTARRSSPAATRSPTSTSSWASSPPIPVPEGQLPLLERPQLIALNKIDVPEARELADFVRPSSRSAATACSRSPTVSHEGLRELSFALAELVDQARRAMPRPSPRTPRIVIRPKVRRRRRSSPCASRAAATARSTGCSARSPSAGCSRPTSPTTRPSASSPTGSRSSASKTSSFKRGRRRRIDGRHRPGLGRRLRLGAHAHLDGRAHHRAARHRRAPRREPTRHPRRAPRASTTSAWTPRPRRAPSCSASARPGIWADDEADVDDAAVDAEDVTGRSEQ